MRIRTQLLLAIGICVTLGLVALAATIHAANQLDTAAEREARAQVAAHEVSGLLILTQEYARHAEPRAARQWHQRQASLAAALADERQPGATVSLSELRTANQALPQLFVRLEEIAARDDDFSLRRKEVLLDQLLNAIQAMSDNALDWHREATQVSDAAQSEFRVIAVATPLAMLALLIALLAIVRQRVLMPIQRLAGGTTAVGQGDLSVRLACVARDELGDLSRRFDSMTAALQRSGEQMRRSQEQLRAIADNIPALVGHFDAQERCQFANNLALKIHGISPADAGRHTLRSAIGEENYALHAPHVRKVLAGQTCQFEGHLKRKGRDVYFQANLVPDISDDGSVGGFYLMTFDVTALKRVEKQLEVLARFDPLTGLPNRLQFNERLPEALRRAQRTRRLVAVMFLDIDHFKSINDTHGHAAGDAVLKEFAARLAASVRSTDTVVRLGGDEFVVILEGLRGMEEPQFVARKIIAQLARPVELDGRNIDITTSVGIAVHDGLNGEIAPQVLLERADGALYEAKRAGRNTYCVARGTAAAEASA